jgi:beta-mannanase
MSKNIVIQIAGKPYEFDLYGRAGGLGTIDLERMSVEKIVRNYKHEVSAIGKSGEVQLTAYASPGTKDVITVHGVDYDCVRLELGYSLRTKTITSVGINAYRTDRKGKLSDSARQAIKSSVIDSGLEYNQVLEAVGSTIETIKSSVLERLREAAKIALGAVAEIEALSYDANKSEPWGSEVTA